MNDHLVIFVDGFPYELAEKMDSFRKFSYRAALKTGIGYSINIHAEIFAGLPADRVGFFNTWKFEPAHSPFRRLKGMKNFLRKTEDNRYLNRIFRSMVKFVCGTDSLNIPYKAIDMFAPCGHLIDAADFPAPKITPDRSFSELDTAAHRFGLDSGEYNDCIKRLDARIGGMFDEFRSVHPKGHIAVLSDHGMARVRKAVKFGPEEDLPEETMGKFIYFLDTTMIRIWYLDPAVRGRVESYLNGKDCGKLLTEEERRDLGIIDRRWADNIFLLNEGCVFDPSFLEKGHPLAMHGYHPDLPSQKGIFLYSGPRAISIQGTIDTKTCHDLLKGIIFGKDEF